jgi:hypothetical protein
MSDYGWFALKGICYLVLIGFVCWFMHSAWPLWALLLVPFWSGDDKKSA